MLNNLHKLYGEIEINRRENMQRYMRACSNTHMHSARMHVSCTHHLPYSSKNKLPYYNYYQLVLLNSISDEELTQTIGVICSSMGGGGLACSTAMNALNSLPLVHRWCLAACLKFKFMSRRHTHTEKKRETTWPKPDRQTLLTETQPLFPLSST